MGDFVVSQITMSAVEFNAGALFTNKEFGA